MIDLYDNYMATHNNAKLRQSKHGNKMFVGVLFMLYLMVECDQTAWLQYNTTQQYFINPER